MARARKRNAARRNKGKAPLPLRDHDQAVMDQPLELQIKELAEQLGCDSRDIDAQILRIEEALTKLRKSYRLEAEIIERTVFGRGSAEEVAESLKSTDDIEITPQVVAKRLEFARAWLYKEMQP